MTSTRDAGPVRNVERRLDIDPVLCQVVGRVLVNVLLNLGHRQPGRAARGQQDGVDAAAGPQFKNVFALERHRHQNFAQLDAVRSRIPDTRGDVELHREAAERLL